MTPRLKPTEVKGVAAILDQDHDTAETAAEAVIRWLDAKRAKDPAWVAIIHTHMAIGEQPLVIGRGTYSTRKKAETAAMSLRADKVPWSFRILQVTREEP